LNGTTSFSGWDTNVSDDLTSTSTITGLIQSTITGNSYFTGGKVGIGTTSPGEKLSISGGNILTSGVIYSSGTATSKFEGGLQVGYGIQASTGVFSGDVFITGKTVIGNTTFYADGLIETSSNAKVMGGNVQIGSDWARRLSSDIYGISVSTNLYVVGYSSATKYYGDGSGLYGVTGTIDNAVRLDTGTLRTDLTAEISSRSASDIAIGFSTGTILSSFSNYVATYTAQHIADVKTFISSTVFSSATFSGNVGIGTTNPGARLDVRGIDTQAFNLAVGTATTPYSMVVTTSFWKEGDGIRI